MAGQTDNRSNIKRLTLGFSGLLIVGFSLYMFFLIGTAIWRNYRMNQTIEYLKATIEMMEIENSMRYEFLSYYSSDSFREVELRRRLVMKKPGEKVIILPLRNEAIPNDLNSSSQINKVGDNAPESNYIKWWRLFFADSLPS